MSKAFSEQVQEWLKANHKDLVPTKAELKNVEPESSVYAFLVKNLENQIIMLGSNGRVHFRATGQDSVCKLDQLLGYNKSKTHQKAVKARLNQSVDLSKYAPYIVPHREDPTKVFCIVTHDDLNLNEEEIERHISGANYIKMRLRNERARKKKLDRMRAPVINDAELLAIADSESEAEGDGVAGQDYSHIDLALDPVLAAKEAKKNKKMRGVDDEIEGENEEVDMPIVKKTKNQFKTVIKVPVMTKKVVAAKSKKAVESSDDTTEQPLKTEKFEKSTTFDKSKKLDKSAAFDKTEKFNRTAKFNKSSKFDRNSKFDQNTKFDRNGKFDRNNRGGRGGKFGSTDRDSFKRRRQEEGSYESQEPVVPRAPRTREEKLAERAAKPKISKAERYGKVSLRTHAKEAAKAARAAENQEKIAWKSADIRNKPVPAPEKKVVQAVPEKRNALNISRSDLPKRARR